MLTKETPDSIFLNPDTHFYNGATAWTSPANLRDGSHATATFSNANPDRASALRVQTVVKPNVQAYISGFEMDVNYSYPPNVSIYLQTTIGTAFYTALMPSQGLSDATFTVLLDKQYWKPLNTLVYATIQMPNNPTSQQVVVYEFRWIYTERLSGVVIQG